MRERYKKIEGWGQALKPCPFCGTHAEMWEYESGLCGNKGDEDGEVECCPMYMPPDGFYKATKLEAMNLWNTRKAT